MRLFYCILKCIEYFYFHNLCYNHSIVMTACIKMNNICILLYKENSVFQKSNSNEQNRAARKIKAMTQTFNNASEINIWISSNIIIPRTAGIIRPGTTALSCLENQNSSTVLSLAQPSTQSSALGFQPAVFCFVLGWLPGWSAISPLEGGDAGLVYVPALCR